MGKIKGVSNIDIDENKVDKLLSYLEKNYKWWNSKILKDKELSVDIRKDNSLNVYYNAASFFRIWANFDRKIQNIKKVTFRINKKYLHEEEIKKLGLEIKTKKYYLEISNLENYNFAQHIKSIKENIKIHHNKPEKIIQHKYAICNGETEGVILDTEFAYKNYKNKNKKIDFRIDMAYLHKSGELYFVELKRKTDKRAKDSAKEDTSLASQLKKNTKFLSNEENCKELKEYYSKILNLKNKYGLLKEFPCKIKEVKSIVPKPILLVGDASNDFIEDYENELKSSRSEFYKEINNNCCYCVYRGNGSNYINLDKKNIRNIIKSSDRI